MARRPSNEKPKPDVPLPYGRGSLIALAALALGACTVGPDFKKPETPLPAAFNEGAASAAAQVPANWWTLYHDAELTRLIDLAFKQSPTVEKAMAKIEEADAYARQVGANALPEIDGSASGNRSKYSSVAGSPAAGSFAGGTYSTFTAGLSTSFELDFYGKLRRAREGARAQARASRDAAAVVRIPLAGQIAQQYWAVRSLEAQVKTTAGILEDSRASLQLAEKRAAGGTSSSLDVAQAKGALASLLAQQADLNRQRKLANHQLALLCGAPDLVLAPGAFDARPPLPPAGLPSDLLKLRPDIQSAQETLRAANASIGYTQAFKYPTFSITGALGLQSRELSQFLTKNAGTWSLGAGVYAPILDWGNIDAQVDGAKARARQAGADYVGTVQTAFSEVRSALVENGSRAEMDGLLGDQLAAAKQALKLAQSRYDSGYSPYLEVLDSRRDVNNAELAWQRNREAQWDAGIQLFKALGGGWKDDSQSAPKGSAK